MRANVIGATGLVGSELLSLLLEDKNYSEVHVFSRRATGITHAKLKEHIISFNAPTEWSQLITGDVLFSTLGTTLKKAGSKEKQWEIDYSYQYEFAKAAANNRVPYYVLVSSAGADPQSSLFYSKMKGKLEAATSQLGFKKHYILRPSLLLGNREEKRFGEKIAQKILPQLTRFVFKKYKPIKAATVAHAMINAISKLEEKCIYELDEIFDLARTQ